eukprot:CAMPEP_0171006326 /NCGR_PEP_ID=MMETSP0736-20130129/18977_1 /TAXON_ID=186038 /ORGANISM="Fragilariopsis kerguelensis, Strain L26-C5" /LENGTH=43 /DNA_ID= /DNA_START= /DNA_END= /DNA_ORIENTATION=
MNIPMQHFIEKHYGEMRDLGIPSKHVLCRIPGGSSVPAALNNA